VPENEFTELAPPEQTVPTLCAKPSLSGFGTLVCINCL
jgi:hypothetical protein